MYLNTTATGPDELARFQNSMRLVRLVLPADQLARTARAELWSSSFSDEGEDYNEVHLFDHNNALIATHRINGY